VIAIIGGGISGLAAAYELATRQVPFTLFESSDRVGGLVRTERVEGFTVEAGADSMLVQKRAGLELCDELGLTPRLISMKHPRTAFVLHHGQLHPLPSRSIFGIPARWTDLARYSLLPVAARARLAIEPLIGLPRDGADESVAAFFRRRLGASTVDVLAQPLLGGIHAGDVESLSLRALFPRLAAAEQSGRKVLRWVRHSARARPAGGAFASLSSGMGELVEAIVRRLPDDAVRCSSGIVALARPADAWEVVTGDGRLKCKAVILACPANIAGDLLASIDEVASALCAQVRYVSTVSIGLGWPRNVVAHPLNGSGFVVARASNDGVRITACTWVSSKWEGRAPADHVLLRAYLGGAHDPLAVDLPDEQLLDITVRELSAILSISGAPRVARVFRWRDAGAQHEVGHLARMNTLEQRLAQHVGLFVTGSGFRSIGIPDCIADGRAIAGAASRLVA
jgi:protoporphyrinogen/coproporphyrinogen III oxidase